MKAELRILHVIAGLPKAAGTTAFVENAVDHLSKLGHSVSVATGIREVINCANVDLVHIHGLWSPLLHRARRWAQARNIPIVWSTHGMTAPWSMRHKRLKKLLVWTLYQRRDLRAAALIHSTTDMERGWNAALGFERQIVVPLGTNLPEIVECRNTGPLRVLFVGRIYPVKGLLNVVRAASHLKGAKIEFRIVGPDQAGHQAELMAEADRLGVGNLFVWAGPKYGSDLADEYDKCDMLMLPSQTENFGATVVDAMAHGKPVLASKYTPWQDLASKGCGWWVDNSPEQLAESLGEICAMDRIELMSMGARGRRFVEETYSWSSVASALEKAYLEVVNG